MITPPRISQYMQTALKENKKYLCSKRLKHYKNKKIKIIVEKNKDYEKPFSKELDEMMAKSIFCIIRNCHCGLWTEGCHLRGGPCIWTPKIYYGIINRFKYKYLKGE